MSLHTSLAALTELSSAVAALSPVDRRALLNSCRPGIVANWANMLGALQDAATATLVVASLDGADINATAAAIEDMWSAIATLAVTAAGSGAK